PSGWSWGFVGGELSGAFQMKEIGTNNARRSRGCSNHVQLHSSVWRLALVIGIGLFLLSVPGWAALFTVSGTDKDDVIEISERADPNVNAGFNGVIIVNGQVIAQFNGDDDNQFIVKPGHGRD